MKKLCIVCIAFLMLACSGSGSEPPKPETKNWTVTFNSNEGSAVSPIGYVKDGAIIKKPTDPARKRFIFNGWFTDNTTFINAWDFARSQVISDTTLHAKWIPGPPAWTVTFDTNGGSEVNAIEDVDNGTTIKKPANPLKKEFMFNGWYTDNETFKNSWNFTESKVVSDTTLYAKWIPESALPMRLYNNLAGLVLNCADPYVLKYNEKYYLYGTGGSDGIRVYQSDDMVNWSSAVGIRSGYALHKDDVWGDANFWAPEVYYLDGKFYMFYSAEEHISVAESESPLGPFTQSVANKKPLHASTKEIDTHMFIDDNGKKYLYFVRFSNGNHIWGAELNDDMRSIKESTLTRCISASEPWELIQDRIAEGPFMLKHNGLYYLTYSANHYVSPKYGVGYATSNSPLGPWKKYEKNPILIGNDKIQGVGHHSFITVEEGCTYMIYHSHYSMTSVHNRKLGIDPYEFIPSTDGSPDIIKVYGPTTTLQNLCVKPEGF